jgi:alpha-amylase
MGTVTLLLGIHNHQPQGNFDHVLRQGYEDCYRRLLDAIGEHPGVRITLHYSGPLIEWLEDHHPEYFDALADMVDTGQVEMMGGGFYEPMLSVLPERDAAGQLEMMSEFIEGRVGRRPRGMWLAERVWEPDLPRVIAAAGYRYTVLDDSHFLAAGMRRPLRGFYVTDKAGIPLCVFPISMELRYAIPFKPAREAIDTLLAVADEAGGDNLVVTYGDDGEKFGMWPGTKQWVWDEGWLDQFLTLLEQNTDRIRTATFSDVLQRRAPSGRVYLPTASYDEMGEWALPADAQDRFHALSHSVEEREKKEDWGPFVRGGIWQGFLAKYPESNFMHKRMCYVSTRVARAAALAGEGGDPTAHKDVENATKELYRGQCNCAYWHGLFGGLYLAKLRSAVHTHLIRADLEASKVLGTPAPVQMERLDLDGDLNDEVILRGRSIGLVVSPGRGGALMAIDDRQRAFCLTDVLTRQREAYHKRVLELSAGALSDDGGGDGPKSIHDIAQVKDEGLADILVYDPHQRLAFVDQFFAAGADLSQLWRGESLDLGDFGSASYDLLQAAGGSGHLLLGREGVVRTGDGTLKVSLQKSYRIDDDGLVVGYGITSEQRPSALRFATELSLALPSGPHPDVQYLIQSGRGERREPVTGQGVDHEVRRVVITDPNTSMTVVLQPDPAATLVRFPLETASQSESGFERTYQGSTLVLSWAVPEAHPVSFKPGLRLQLR